MKAPSRPRDYTFDPPWWYTASQLILGATLAVGLLSMLAILLSTL